MRRFNLLSLVFSLAIAHSSAAQPDAVSVPTSAGASAAGSSFAPQFSRDGRYLIFSSHAKNLTTNSDPSPNLNVFRTDLTTGAIDLISVSSDGSRRSAGDS